MESMNSILDFLVSTLEKASDFDEQKLHTLDIKILILQTYRFSIKEKSAISEIITVYSLSEEALSRLPNT